MPSNFDQAFERVKQLAADFKANEHFYLSPMYQEAEARRDFIDKFLIALGWDVNHDTQKNPYEQEVKVERKEHGVSQRHADYAFYVAPNFQDVKFHIEAKKPFADIATTDNYFQTIRYGWGSKTPIALLFDFEQLEIVDCRFKPNLDTALQRNLKKFHYSQYTNKEIFAEIYWLFSREAVGGRSLEKYAEALPRKRGTAQRGIVGREDQPVDEAFLEELDRHRDTLARIFKNSNPKLDGDTLTEVTQRTLDRLVFIRFLEDKLIEPQYLVARFGEHGSAWDDFIAASRRLDGIYNGIVFKKHDILDQPKLNIDNDQFTKICKGLCHVKSIYNFNTIPIHILGSIYERFLGKVIVATDKRARVEEKPEVRKAGGVYYTPEYIVRYIVENTVGNLVRGKTPAQIGEMRFADIACGSGSFLLGVYDLLIRCHAKYYNENPGKAKTGDVVEREDGLHLSLEKKREILLNNIYGVDIDRQAVEVAQLSLYLKLLQDETPSSARTYQLEFHETLLPSLNKNIVCGNSLIGTDILTSQLFASEEEKKLNPMDFEQRFPHIYSLRSGGDVLRETATPLDFTFPGGPLHGRFSYKKMKSPPTSPLAMPEFDGGFDAIVGNPPYGATLTRFESEYLAKKFKFQQYQLDSYLLFIERALSIAAENALIGMIIPNTWLLNLLSPQIRREIFNHTKIERIVHYRYPVFSQATVDTEVTIFRKQEPSATHKVTIAVVGKDGNSDLYCVSQQRWRDADGKPVNIFEKPQLVELADKLKGFARLNDLFHITQGAKPFQVGKGKPKQTQRIVDEKPFVAEKKVNATFRPLLRGSLINKYQTLWRQDYWISLGDWLAEPRYSANYDAAAKIVIRQTGDSLVATLDREKFVVRDNLYTIVPSNSELDLRFALGLINSSLLNWFYQNILNPERGEALAQVKRGHLAELPIRSIDFSNPTDKARHDRLVALVEQMLATKKQLASAQTDKDKDFYANRCDGLNRQIDTQVYGLYGLTPAEIKIVTGNAK